MENAQKYANNYELNTYIRANDRECVLRTVYMDQ